MKWSKKPRFDVGLVLMCLIENVSVWMTDGGNRPVVLQCWTSTRTCKLSVECSLWVKPRLIVFADDSLVFVCRFPFMLFIHVCLFFCVYIFIFDVNIRIVNVYRMYFGQECIGEWNIGWKPFLTNISYLPGMLCICLLFCYRFVGFSGVTAMTFYIFCTFSVCFPVQSKQFIQKDFRRKKSCLRPSDVKTPKPVIDASMPKPMKGKKKSDFSISICHQIVFSAVWACGGGKIWTDHHPGSFL